MFLNARDQFQKVHPNSMRLWLIKTAKSMKPSKIKKIIKMNKIILFVILFSGLNSNPITRDASMENQSRSGNQIHRRSTEGHRCRETVVIHCELQKKTFSSENRLGLYAECLYEGFTQRCG